MRSKPFAFENLLGADVVEQRSRLDAMKIKLSEGEVDHQVHGLCRDPASVGRLRHPVAQVCCLCGSSLDP